MSLCERRLWYFPFRGAKKNKPNFADITTPKGVEITPETSFKMMDLIDITCWFWCI
jgi:hypothetical protein